MLIGFEGRYEYSKVLVLSCFFGPWKYFQASGLD